MNKNCLYSFLGGVSLTLLSFVALPLFLTDKEDDHDHHHEEAEESLIIALNETQKNQSLFELTPVQKGKIVSYESAQGVVELNPDKVAHIISKAAGIVSQSKKSVGDKVLTGEVLAVIESEELAKTINAYLESERNLSLLKTRFEKAAALYEKNIGSELDLIHLEKEVEGAEQNYLLMKDRLALFNVNEEDVKNKENSMLSLKVLAPFSGTILEKHLAVGESLSATDEIFKIADLTNVKVKLGVAEKLLPFIKKGQRVEIEDAVGRKDLGYVERISHEVDKESGHILVYVNLKNPYLYWKSGAFVTANIALKEQPGDLIVPKSAIFELQNTPHVFVETEEGFEAKPVVIECQDDLSCSIKEGVETGDRVVSKNGERLKFQLTKRDGEHEH